MTNTNESIDSKLPEFGDYVSIEQYRYCGGNEYYIHKVIGTLRSNTWIDIPAQPHLGATQHETMEDIVNVICCGVCEETVHRYRVCDVKITKQRFPQANEEKLQGQSVPDTKVNLQEKRDEILEHYVGRTEIFLFYSIREAMDEYAAICVAAKGESPNQLPHVYKIIQDRADYLRKIFHLFEAVELENALEVIKRLVPPSLNH